MIRVPFRVVAVALLAVLSVLPTLALRIEAPANHGAHGLTAGFGRGRLDLQGLVSEGLGHLDLPRGTRVATVRVSGPSPIQILAERSERTVTATDAPVVVRIPLTDGGRVTLASPSRIRLHEIVLERSEQSVSEIGLVSGLGLLAVGLALRGTAHAVVASLVLLGALSALTAGTFTATVAIVGLVQLRPLAMVMVLFLPLILALRFARFPGLWPLSRRSRGAFAGALALAAVQFILFDPPLPMGDPGAYLEMGGRFADAMTRIRSPFDLGPILSDLQPYLALPATGLLYGLLLIPGLLALVYTVQALAVAWCVALMVAICEAEVSVRAAKVALVLALLHPTFAVLPGIVQPEPFILAAWTAGALVALRALRDHDARGLLGASLLLGAGLSLHPQGLSFLLLAMFLCLLPWSRSLIASPRLLVSLGLGAAAVLLPVAAAEHFSKPMAHVLDKQFGFFAYTSPHPLGFWLYTDSDGWQGPLRIEDTTYQKELFALKGDTAVSSTFADVARFAARHPAESLRTVLTNLHRLWHQPDNPFAVPLLLPSDIQVDLHRGLVVLFVLSLPALLGSRLALLALPFVMLSMTYPAYHVFNKYATPALPFTIVGASLVLDRLWGERGRLRALWVGLGAGALGVLAPATWFAQLGMSGDAFLLMARALLWTGLGLALVSAIRSFALDARSRVFGAIVGVVVLLASSIVASRSDTTRGAWSVSLTQPFEATCRVPGAPVTSDPAWILIDAQAGDATPPRIEINGVTLSAAVPTMPTFGLATIRGRRDPAIFRQLWRAPISEDLLAAGELRIRVTGSVATRVFGDIRTGSEGPRLSLGNWPYLSVYRLMHEGQYRLPTTDLPPQSCLASSLSGRPGVMLIRIPAGEEGRMAQKAGKPPFWAM